MQACRYAPSLIYDSSEDITGFPHGDAYLGKIISVHLTWFRPSHLRYLDEWIVPSRSALPRVRCLIVTVHDENWASESSQWTETRPLGAPILAGRALLLPPTGVVPNTFTTTAKRRRHLQAPPPPHSWDKKLTTVIFRFSCIAGYLSTKSKRLHVIEQRLR